MKNQVFSGQTDLRLFCQQAGPLLLFYAKDLKRFQTDGQKIFVF